MQREDKPQFTRRSPNLELFQEQRLERVPQEEIFRRASVLAGQLEEIPAEAETFLRSYQGQTETEHDVVSEFLDAVRRNDLDRVEEIYNDLNNYGLLLDADAINKAIEESILLDSKDIFDLLIDDSDVYASIKLLLLVMTKDKLYYFEELFRVADLSEGELRHLVIAAAKNNNVEAIKLMLQTYDQVIDFTDILDEARLQSRDFRNYEAQEYLASLGALYPGFKVDPDKDKFEFNRIRSDNLRNMVIAKYKYLTPTDQLTVLRNVRIYNISTDQRARDRALQKIIFLINKLPRAKL